MGSGWPFQFLPLRSSEGPERPHMFQKITLGQRKTSNGEEFEFVSMSNVSAKPPVQSAQGQGSAEHRGGTLLPTTAPET